MWLSAAGGRRDSDFSECKRGTDQWYIFLFFKDFFGTDSKLCNINSILNFKRTIFEPHLVKQIRGHLRHRTHTFIITSLLEMVNLFLWL